MSRMYGCAHYLQGFHTNPDLISIDFVPGLGIVGYEYRHHGTLSRANVCLIEFGTAKAGK